MFLTPKERLVKARIKMLRKNPFFAHLSLYLNIIESEEKHKTGGTIGVDFNGNVYFDKDFINELNDDQLMFLIAHETSHLALQHLFRMGTRHKTAWNVAVDYAVNSLLVENAFQVLNSSCYDPDYDNMSAEQIYDLLFKKGRKNKKGNRFIEDDEQKVMDIHIYGDKEGKTIIDEKELKDKQQKWKKRLSEASVLAKQRGTLSNGLERLIDDVLETRQNWKQLLYKYITHSIPFDYTYSYPSKRGIATGVYLPSIRKENIEFAVAIDTSGSISEKEIKEFIGDVKGILTAFNNINITLIVCDDRIQETYNLDRNTDINDIKFKGFGGTSHIPVYEWLEKNKPNTQLLINFTDGYTRTPKTELFKTIWVLTDEGTKDYLEFGEIIKKE